MRRRGTIHPAKHLYVHATGVLIVIILIMGPEGGVRTPRTPSLDPPLRLLAISEVVFIKMPSRQQQRRAKQRAEYLQNRNEELDTSRVRRNNSNRASKRGHECCIEQNSDDIRASKKQKYQETNRDSKRSVY